MWFLAQTVQTSWDIGTLVEAILIAFLALILPWAWGIQRRLTKIETLLEACLHPLGTRVERLEDRVATLEKLNVSRGLQQRG